MNNNPCFRLLKISFILIVLFYTPNAWGQTEGCTDPYALNYNSNATWNDGSCIYEETIYIPPPFLDLPAAVAETSGLIFWSGGIWTFNDSGGNPELYKVDTISGDIVQTVTITNGNNVDWEDIAQDDQYIYVGDFGNNAGNRKDLVIYKLPKSGIPVTGNIDIQAEVIAYSYADQDDFTPSVHNNEYDCEAIIWIDDSLYLFTKNWVSETTRLYILPDEPGSYEVWPTDSLDVDGLVTGAAYSDELGQVVLLGYKSYIPFMFLLFDYHENDLFSGNKRRIQMPGLLGVQTEGICFMEGYDGFISCEQSLINQKLFTFSTREWTDTTLLHIRESFDKLEVEVHPNPVDSGLLTINIHNSRNESYHIKLYDSSGKIVYRREHKATAGSSKQTFIINIPEIMPGMYFLQILADEFYAKEKVVVR